MTKQEIIALIAAKIEGQGSQVDVGGGLPKILKGIIDLIQPAPEPIEPEPLVVDGTVEESVEESELIFVPGDVDFDTALPVFEGGGCVLLVNAVDEVRVISAHLIYEGTSGVKEMIGIDTTGKRWVWREEVEIPEDPEEPIDPEEPEE